MNYAYGLYAADGRKLQTTHRGHAFVNYQNTGIDELRDHCGGNIMVVPGFLIHFHFGN